jgi:hypothetical protein
MDMLSGELVKRTRDRRSGRRTASVSAAAVSVSAAAASASAPAASVSAPAASASVPAAPGQLQLLVEYASFVTGLALKASRACGLHGDPWPSTQVQALAWLDGAAVSLRVLGSPPCPIGKLAFGAATFSSGRKATATWLRAPELVEDPDDPFPMRLPALFLEAPTAHFVAYAARELCRAPLFVLAGGVFPAPSKHYVPAHQTHSELPALFVHASLLGQILLCRLGDARERPNPLRHLVVEWPSLVGPAGVGGICPVRHERMTPAEAVLQMQAFIATVGARDDVGRFPLRDCLPALLEAAFHGRGVALPLPPAPSAKREPLLHKLVYGPAWRPEEGMVPPVQMVPLHVTRGVCMVLGEAEEDAEDTLEMSPLTWVHLDRAVWHCEDCLDRAAHTSVCGRPGFIVEALAGMLRSSAGLRWDEATGGVFGRHPLMVPLLLLFFVPMGDRPAGCLCGGTLTPAELERAHTTLSHGLGARLEAEAAADRMQMVVGRIMDASRRPGLSRGKVLMTEAVAIYLGWCVREVRASLLLPERSPVSSLRLERVDLRMPIGHMPSVRRAEEMGAAAGGPVGPAAAAPGGWCFLCGMAPPCLHAVISAAGDLFRGGALQRPLLSNERLDFWREEAAAYAGAVQGLLVGSRRETYEQAGASILSADVQEVAARMCLVLERSLDAAIQPRCPTCSTTYALVEGCTHVRCTACDRHHCHICDRRFAALEQPDSTRRLVREIRDVGEQLKAVAEAASGLPEPMRPCTLHILSEASELFALTQTHERALQRGLPVSGPQTFGLTDRFSHASSVDSACPTFIHDGVNIHHETPDASLMGIAERYVLTREDHTVYMELGARAGQTDSRIDDTDNEEHPEHVGAAIVLRITHRLAAIARRVRLVLDVPPDASPLRWAWPILMHAGGRWASGQTPDQRAAAPLTPLCLAWLLGVHMKCRVDDRLVPIAPGHKQAMPAPRTLLERLIYTLALRLMFIETDEADEQDDDDDAVRYPTAEASAHSLLEPVGMPHLYLSVGLLDCVGHRLRV